MLFLFIRSFILLYINLLAKEKTFIQNINDYINLFNSYIDIEDYTIMSPIDGFRKGRSSAHHLSSSSSSVSSSVVRDESNSLTDYIKTKIVSEMNDWTCGKLF